MHVDAVHIHCHYHASISQLIRDCRSMVSTGLTSGRDLNSKCVSVRCVGAALVRSNICVVLSACLRTPRMIWQAMTLFVSSEMGAIVSSSPRCEWDRVTLTTSGTILVASMMM